VRGRFAYVIVDTPPALAVTDATLVGVLVDGMSSLLGRQSDARGGPPLRRTPVLQTDIRILGDVLTATSRPRPALQALRSYELYAAPPPPPPPPL